MTLTRRAALAALLSATLASAVHAQFAGPVAGSVINTVRDVLERGRDDQMVVLEGYIVNQLKHDKFTFRDDTGSIIVEIDEKVFRGQMVDVNTKIRVEGEVEREYLRPNEVDVERLTILN